MNFEQLTPEDKLMVWLDAASSMFPSSPLNPNAKSVWIRLMSKYAPEQIDRAFEHWMDNAKKMPVPSDIRDIIEGGSVKEKALAAWTRVVAAMSDVGDARSICFDDPLIHLVIADMGGWTMMNKISDDKLPFAANEFQKRYLTMLDKPRESLGPVPRSLAGNMAVYNSGKVNAPPEHVVLYGDEDKAEMVFQGGAGSGQAVLIYRAPSVMSLSYTPMPAEAGAAPKQLSY